MNNSVYCGTVYQTDYINEQFQLSHSGIQNTTWVCTIRTQTLANLHNLD